MSQKTLSEVVQEKLTQHQKQRDTGMEHILKAAQKQFTEDFGDLQATYRYFNTHTIKPEWTQYGVEVTRHRIDITSGTIELSIYLDEEPNTGKLVKAFYNYDSEPMGIDVELQTFNELMEVILNE